MLGVVARAITLGESMPVWPGLQPVAAGSKRNLMFVPRRFTGPVMTPLNPSHVRQCHSSRTATTTPLISN
jgi:hypothetical protein